VECWTWRGDSSSGYYHLFLQGVHSRGPGAWCVGRAEGCQLIPLPFFVGTVIQRFALASMDRFGLVPVACVGTFCLRVCYWRERTGAFCAACAVVPALRRRFLLFPHYTLYTTDLAFFISVSRFCDAHMALYPYRMCMAGGVDCHLPCYLVAGRDVYQFLGMFRDGGRRRRSLVFSSVALLPTADIRRSAGMVYQLKPSFRSAAGRSRLCCAFAHRLPC